MPKKKSKKLTTKHSLNKKKSKNSTPEHGIEVAHEVDEIKRRMEYDPLMRAKFETLVKQCLELRTKINKPVSRAEAEQIAFNTMGVLAAHEKRIIR